MSFEPTKKPKTNPEGKKERKQKESSADAAESSATAPTASSLKTVRKKKPSEATASSSKSGMIPQEFLSEQKPPQDNYIYSHQEDPVIQNVKNFYFIKFNKDSEIELVREKITFDWANTNLAFINSFRRVLFSEIETYVLGKFDFFSYSVIENCNPLEMSRLQPVMHNEQLSLALEMIPIFQNIEGIDMSNLVVSIGSIETPYTIDPRFQIKDIYTDDLVVTHDGMIIENNRLFPNRVLITKLKVNQKIGFKCSPIKGQGKTNAKFMPVCPASFEYQPIEQKSATPYENEYQTNIISQEVTEFKFLIHSLPYYEPERLLMLGFYYFYKLIKRNIKKLQDIKSSNSFTFSLNNDSATIKFELLEENYTIGNLIQNYLIEDQIVKFAGFINEHPKDNKLKCCVSIIRQPSVEMSEKEIENLIFEKIQKKLLLLLEQIKNYSKVFSQQFKQQDLLSE
jgi:DNA-directed RNA polymerase subunit L